MSAAIVERKQLLDAIGDAQRIVFDLDGTLYDTRDFERPALTAVAEWLSACSGLSLQGMLRELWDRRETDRHRPGLFDAFLVTHGLPAAWGAECVRRFRAYQGKELEDASSLRPQIVHLRSEGRRCALVTNGRAELQKRKLTLLRVLDLFDVCLFLDPEKPEELKPAPVAWQRLEEWRSNASTVYVGDDPVDARFAAAGNVRFVHFCFRSSSYEH